MSHELRTPLNIILGYTELLLDGAFGALGEEQHDTVDRVRQQSNDLLLLINATLDVNRLEAGGMPLELEDFRLAPLLDNDTNELDLRLFTDYVRGELASGETLPRLPPLRYGARVEYHDERLLVGFEAARYGEQDEVAPFEDETPGYTLMNADARWRLNGMSGIELELFLNASNLGGEEARKHTSFVKDVAPLPGRNYTLGIRSRF